MVKSRYFHTLAGAAAMLFAGVTGSLRAQGVTTAAISGVVAEQDGRGIENAQVRVTNGSTGYGIQVLTRGDGDYYVQGLEVGGPYSVAVRILGYAPEARDSLRLALGQNLVVDFTLRQQAAQLAGVTVSAAESDPVFSPSASAPLGSLADRREASRSRSTR